MTQERISRRRVRLRRAAASIAVASGAASLVALYAGPSSGDDTLIYMRYVENALAGHGFVFNIGEQSYGATSSLWMLAMTPVAWLAGNTVWAWKATGAALLGLSAGIQHAALTRARFGGLTAVLLAALVIADPHLLRWGATGMENGLAAFLLVLTAAKLQTLMSDAKRDAAIHLGILCGLLPFARPELAVLSLVLVAVVCFESRHRAALVVAFAITGAAMLAVTYGALGAVLPQTAEAKAIFLRQTSPLYGITQASKITISGAGAALLAYLLARRAPISRGTRAWLIASGSALAAGIAYLATRNQLVSTRYSSYLCTPIAIGAAWVIADLWRSSMRQARAAAMGVAASCAVVAWQLFPATRTNELESAAAVAKIGKVAGPDARIAAREIGLLGHATGRYIVDVVGLVDRETVAWGREHGRWTSTAELEPLLRHRRATHYVDCFSERPIVGESMRFREVMAIQVARNNLSAGRIMTATWKLYELEDHAPSRHAASP